MGCGGKGANQAVAAARLGSRVLVVSRVGDDMFAANTVRNFEDNGIDTTHVLSTPGASAVANVYAANSVTKRGTQTSYADASEFGRWLAGGSVPSLPMDSEVADTSAREEYSVHTEDARRPGRERTGSSAAKEVDRPGPHRPDTPDGRR